jgi:hypothetical protein
VATLLLAMSVAWAVVPAAVGSVAEAGVVLLRADTEVVTAALLLVATLPLLLVPMVAPAAVAAAVVVVALDTVEATATHLVQAATLGGKCATLVHDTVRPRFFSSSLGCRRPALHDG